MHTVHGSYTDQGLDPLPHSWYTMLWSWNSCGHRVRLALFCIAIRLMKGKICHESDSVQPRGQDFLPAL